ncbi:hypothetical protein GmRootA79_53130 (plasmid) [Acidovorax sp. A79]|uniref:IPTL-CTERM sorting domain-containing protein n=1 Tax=Acidovorax sp. A79 TaxID=3056107 RepID=UPI0034E881CE
MKKTLTLLAAAFLQAGAWAATYTYTGPAYTAPALHNFTNCLAGNCGAYTTAMGQAGSFSTASPLPNNLSNQDIMAQVTSFSFTDGLTTYASSDPQVSLAYITATTMGGVLDLAVAVQRWQTPAPHAQGDHIDFMNIHYGGAHNGLCNAPPGLTVQGAVMCGNIDSGDAYSSQWDGEPGGTWALSATPPTPGGVNAVPTLGEWGLLLLSALMVGVGAWRWRKQRSA